MGEQVKMSKEWAELENNICELITKFENKNKVKVTNIGYVTMDRKSTNDPLFRKVTVHIVAE